MSAAKLDDKGIVRFCPRCGQKNRVPYQKLGAAGACGKCGAGLPNVWEPIEIDSEAHFQALISQSALPVLVDFWAPWCPPCRALAPELVKVAQDHAGRYIVAKADTDKLPNLGARFHVRSIPTMAVFKNGEEVARTMGAQPAATIEGWIHEALSTRAAR